MFLKSSIAGLSRFTFEASIPATFTNNPDEKKLFPENMLYETFWRGSI